MSPEITREEGAKKLEAMRHAAATLKIYSYAMRFGDPKKQTHMDKIKVLSERILNHIEELET